VLRVHWTPRDRNRDGLVTKNKCAHDSNREVERWVNSSMPARVFFTGMLLTQPLLTILIVRVSIQIETT